MKTRLYFDQLTQAEIEQAFRVAYGQRETNVAGMNGGIRVEDHGRSQHIVGGDERRGRLRLIMWEGYSIESYAEIGNNQVSMVVNAFGLFRYLLGIGFEFVGPLSDVAVLSPDAEKRLDIYSRSLPKLGKLAYPEEISIANQKNEEYGRGMADYF